MSWEAVTALSAIFTAIVIAVTAIVGVVQLNHLRAQRRDAAAVDLMRSLQDPELARAFGVIMSVAPGTSADAFQALGREYSDAANIICVRFEALGVLVYRGAVSFEVTEDLAGGGVAGVWRRLKPTIMQRRAAMDHPRYMEWFEWLAEQFEKRGVLEAAPAFQRHREWNRPPKG